MYILIFPDGKPVQVALYHPVDEYLDLDCPGCRKITWPRGQVPISSRVYKTRVETIDTLAFIVVSASACLGIFLAVAFLVFNLTYRRLK